MSVLTAGLAAAGASGGARLRSQHGFHFQEVLDAVRTPLAAVAGMLVAAEGRVDVVRHTDGVADEAVLISITERGYVKRVAASTYKRQGRGGRVSYICPVWRRDGARECIRGEDHRNRPATSLTAGTAIDLASPDWEEPHVARRIERERCAVQVVGWSIPSL